MVAARTPQLLWLHAATTTQNWRNRKQSALKAQLHIARGETPGKENSLSISAPCKGNYIKIEGLKIKKLKALFAISSLQPTEWNGKL
jgi:hypothetical protein